MVDSGESDGAKGVMALDVGEPVATASLLTLMDVNVGTYGDVDSSKVKDKGGRGGVEMTDEPAAVGGLTIAIALLRLEGEAFVIKSANSACAAALIVVGCGDLDGVVTLPLLVPGVTERCCMTGVAAETVSELGS